MKYVFPIKNTIVFSQWSRKSYAVFASLGKVIKIGRVSADISDKSLIKKTSFTHSLNDIACLKKELKDLWEELRQAEGIPDALVAQLTLIMNYSTMVTSVRAEGELVRPVFLKNQSPCFMINKAWTFLLVLHGGAKND
jgi:hypothetical protein